MTSFLDTSVVVRYLTGEPPALAASARALIEDGNEVLTLLPVVLAETAFVLTSRYVMGRADVVDALSDLVTRENVTVEGLPADAVVEALALVRPSGRVSFPDALVWAAARAAGQDTVIYSLDRRFPSGEIDLRRPS